MPLISAENAKEGAWTVRLRYREGSLEVTLLRPDGTFAASKAVVLVRGESACAAGSELVGILLAAHLGSLDDRSERVERVPASSTANDQTSLVPAVATPTSTVASPATSQAPPKSTNVERGGTDARRPEGSASSPAGWSALLNGGVAMLPLRWVAGGGAGYRFSSVPVALGLELSVEHAAPSVIGGSAEIWAGTLRTLGGFWVAGGPWQAAASGMVGARLTAGTTQGPKGTDSAHVYSGELGLRLEGWRRLAGPLRAGVLASLLVELPAPRFTVGASELYAPSQPELAVTLGLGWDFGEAHAAR